MSKRIIIICFAIISVVIFAAVAVFFIFTYKINIVLGPTILGVAKKGTWIIIAPPFTGVKYYANWGEGNSVSDPQKSPVFHHSYSAVGNYSLAFYTTSKGGVASIYTAVNVASNFYRQLWVSIIGKFKTIALSFN